MEGVLISSLARESRLVIVLYGRTLQQPDNNDSSNTPQYKQEELGWAAMQFFNYEGIMIHGNNLLSIWSKECNYIYGPAPSAGVHPVSDHPVLGIEIVTPSRVVFPPVSQSEINKGDFYSLDLQTQQQLIEICEQDMLFKAPTEVREVNNAIKSFGPGFHIALFCRCCGKSDTTFIICLKHFPKCC